MGNDKDQVKAYLLGQAFQPEEIAQYRTSVSRTIEEHEKRLRRGRILASAAWLFCVASAAVWIWSTPAADGWSRGPFLACVFMIVGAVEVLKHSVNSTRVALLVELKQVQVQLFDLEQRMAQQETRSA